MIKINDKRFKGLSIIIIIIAYTAHERVKNKSGEAKTTLLILSPSLITKYTTLRNLKNNCHEQSNVTRHVRSCPFEFPAKV